MRLQKIRSILCLAGLLALGAVSKASTADAKIKISKSLNNSSITVSYHGVHAAMVELSIDGVSIATRSLNSSLSAGESDFTIDSTVLQPGANNCLIQLFDKAGRIVGTSKTTITVQNSGPQPFFLTAPKMGQTLQGPVQISVGFSEKFASPYVSFFIDNQLKSMSNTPPFTFIWDTSRVPNGWHTIQSWMVSNDSTLKSPLLKVFVNNPSGDTPRKSQPDSRPVTTPEARKTQPTAKASGEKSITGKMVAKVFPSTVMDGILSLNQVNASLVNDPRSLKSVQIEKPIMAGPQQMVPQVGNNFALVIPSTKVQTPGAEVGTLGSTVSVLRFLTITDGIHIPQIPSFSIFLDGRQVNFDVQPRVNQGVPMTPLRYLLQQDGGTVKWQNQSKTVTAKDRGQGMWLQIGNKTAKVNNRPLKMERAPYISGSRTIVPLSFIHDALHVNVQYDKKTGHVLITSAKK